VFFNHTNIALDTHIKFCYHMPVMVKCLLTVLLLDSPACGVCLVANTACWTIQ